MVYIKYFLLQNSKRKEEKALEAEIQETQTLRLCSEELKEINTSLQLVIAELKQSNEMNKEIKTNKTHKNSKNKKYIYTKQEKFMIKSVQEEETKKEITRGHKRSNELLMIIIDSNNPEDNYY